MIGKLAAVTVGLGALAAGSLLAVRAPAPALNSALNSARSSAQSSGAKVADSAKGLTAVAGLTVGHHTLTERPTGCTVILTGADGMIAGVDVRGGAPGTRDIELLDPSNSVARVHAIVLSGGSAFGLDAASGVMRYLDERKIGFKIAGTQVPIVPAAILMDLGFGGKPEVRPGPDCGYRAASAATAEAVTEGNVGAGAGATGGKLFVARRAL
jgi:L-aminopeptidase/D-esterase-like protein